MEDESIIEQITPILEKYKRERKNLIPILQDVQDVLHYLPLEAIIEVAGFFYEYISQAPEDNCLLLQELP